ncbi:hypothetical protein ONA91_28605 [Micromonospora sp. DR5-3]|uniref:hypothetical protein n=1 Tax=unclassified Micromonospora TaxID=2617518 RepID=UPI0011D7F549|nr:MULTISPECIES: hypothetical protein [unclassified Micromonospora]MCW3818414.1 hypothetical protein [Micromonospora sp. DR5-3]TYC19543.1 hypothetical protein FXF52_36025 [Micromonospora sp. MP36]
MSIDVVLRELLVRQLDHWLPTALHRSRRATLALAYAGGDTSGAAEALRVVAEFADRLRGRRLTVLVLADGGAELPARLGAAEAALPADVAVHVVPGHPDRLPVALKAAGAARAPLLTVVDGGDPDPAVLAAAASGRPAELLLITTPGRPLRPALTAAGFPLVTEVELVPADDTPARLLGYATASDRSLEAVKDALWAVDEYAGVRYRDPADPAGRLLDITLEPEPGPLRRELLAELTRSGPRTVTELRRFAATSTVYRAADANRALASLLTTGAVTRQPEHGRLGGDVLVTASAGAAG